MGDLMAAKKKKMAAALAAVGLYMQQEEAAAFEEQESLKVTNTGEVSPWGHSGRQEIMTMRRLVQIRAFTRF